MEDNKGAITFKDGELYTDEAKPILQIGGTEHDKMAARADAIARLCGYISYREMEKDMEGLPKPVFSIWDYTLADIRKKKKEFKRNNNE